MQREGDLHDFQQAGYQLYRGHADGYFLARAALVAEGTEVEDLLVVPEAEALLFRLQTFLYLAFEGHQLLPHSNAHLTYYTLIYPSDLL